MSSKLNRD